MGGGAPSSLVLEAEENGTGEYPHSTACAGFLSWNSAFSGTVVREIFFWETAIYVAATGTLQ